MDPNGQAILREKALLEQDLDPGQATAVQKKGDAFRFLGIDSFVFEVWQPSGFTKLYRHSSHLITETIC